MEPEQASNATEHFAAIGRVAEGWASLELLIDMSSWRLAGLVPHVGAALTSQIGGAQRKLDALFSLAKYRDAPPQLLKKLNKFSESVRGLQELRNRIVHDPWVTVGDAPHRFEVSGRKVAKVEGIFMPTSEVNQISDHITDAWVAMVKIHDDLKEIAPPSPDTPT